MTAPLSFDIVANNLTVLANSSTRSLGLNLLGLAADSNQKIRIGGLIDVFCESAPVDVALKLTSDAYIYWSSQFYERHIVPLKSYLKQACEGNSLDEWNIGPHLEELTRFMGTRAFFNCIPHSPWLNKVFQDYFSLQCLDNGFLFIAFSQVFGLQKAYKHTLPYFALTIVAREGKGLDLLDQFIMKLQTENVSTRILHRGLHSFLRIHKLLFHDRKICTLGELELCMQKRRLALLNANLVANTRFTLFGQEDPKLLRSRRNITPGTHVAIVECLEDNQWRKTIATLGEQIGKSGEGDSDRVIHFTVTRLREWVSSPPHERDSFEVGIGEILTDLPDPSQYVVSIPCNEAILGIKKLLSQTIPRWEYDVNLDIPKEESSEERQKRLCDNQPLDPKPIVSSAGLIPVSPLRLDCDGRVALYPRLFPITGELLPDFASNWLIHLRRLTHVPSILKVQFALYDADKNIYYLKLAERKPKDEAELIKLEQELKRSISN